jgi:hypothetical protein
MYYFVRQPSLIPFLIVLVVVVCGLLYLSGSAKGVRRFGLPVFAVLAAILGLIWLVLS